MNAAYFAGAGFNFEADWLIGAVVFGCWLTALVHLLEMLFWVMQDDYDTWIFSVHTTKTRAVINLIARLVASLLVTLTYTYCANSGSALAGFQLTADLGILMLATGWTIGACRRNRSEESAQHTHEC